jgi:(1->4)-alpha-D-glucan 1-alpha-D-glucosylmutase
MLEVIETLLARALDLESNARRLPESTYRLQFHARFRFRDAASIVPYLRELGVTHLYASPYLKARPGSTHGYDITDHSQLNPEIGTEEDYRALITALHAHDLGQIIDMVPNHMGVLGNENPWWNDVLENGPSSPYSQYFDIGWFVSPRPELRGKILLPVLGDTYGRVLEAGQLRLAYDSGAFVLHYFDHRFPVAPRSYVLILGHRLEELEAALGPDSSDLLEYQSILTALRHLPFFTETNPERIAERQREKEVIKRRLASLTSASGAVRGFVERNIEIINGTAGDPHSFDQLDALLNEQPYRLAFWRVASDEINYRRFFDINELAALSMEREEVFTATHALILRLVKEGAIDGLRIDHPDGLYDPEQYLGRLQRYFLLQRARSAYEGDSGLQSTPWEELETPLLERIDQTLRERQEHRQPWPLYTVVEKILGADEPLPDEWPTYGTSGYDFMNQANGLFVDSAAASEFTRIYREWTDDDTPFAEIVYQKKFLILRVALSSELHMLAYQLDRLAQKHRWSRDFTLNKLRHALRSTIAAFPVYRSYITANHVPDRDRKYVMRALRRARLKNPAESPALFDFLREMLLLNYHEGSTPEDQAEQVSFVGKFQQVTSPVMAKGLEDTTFYVYNRLVSLNEVGGDPDHFGVPPANLHRWCRDRQEKWPYALSPLSTHDTKRSEDVRARINVLSEMPGEWCEHLERWSEMNRPHRVTVDEELVAPDANEEYLIYQTLLGAWPLRREEEGSVFVQRIQDYLVKALHEAKVHTSWINPNTAYDDAICQFAERILDPEASAAFLDDFRAFQQRISHYGLFNSLAQTLLRITAPGVPDTYQGTELWDFSLVDPDNRRPVDYELRSSLLAGLKARCASQEGLAEFARELVDHKEDGRIKLYLIWRGLSCLREHAGLFSVGGYVPLDAEGERARHVFAFARRHGVRRALIAIPRLLTRLVPNVVEPPLGPAVWGDTRILLSDVGLHRRFRNVLTGETVAGDRPGQPWLELGEVFRNFPVALLVEET